MSRKSTKQTNKHTNKTPLTPPPKKKLFESNASHRFGKQKDSIILPQGFQKHRRKLTASSKVNERTVTFSPLRIRAPSFPVAVRVRSIICTAILLLLSPSLGHCHVPMGTSTSGTCSRHRPGASTTASATVVVISTTRLLVC
jgi:hypothetical protein